MMLQSKGYKDYRAANSEALGEHYLKLKRLDLCVIPNLHSVEFVEVRVFKAALIFM